MAFDTAGQIINDALVEVGLSSVTDPFSDLDPNVVQMQTLLKTVGRETLREHSWTILRKQATFTTVQGTPSYALPSDFYVMEDQSGWNRTNRLPLGGPLSPQEWQYLKSRLVGVVFTVLFRPMEGMIYIYPDNPTPGGYEIAYEYESDGWIKYSDGGTGWLYRDYPTASSDIVQFDSLMMSRALKLAWLKMHNFDTTSAQQDYNEALTYAKGGDSFVPVLSLTRQSPLRGVDTLIGQQSVPITGFGT
jgi:hypothetical protein